MLGAVTSIAQTGIGGITLAKSPRYGGGDGPLYSTVNGFADRVATGDLAVIRQLDQLRKSDADKVQWQLFWDEMLPLQPLTAAQVKLIKELDPTKTWLAPRSGAAVHAQPGVPLPSPIQVAQGTTHAVEPEKPSEQPPLSNPLSTFRGSSGGLPLWALLLLALGAGFVFFKVVKKGG